MMFWLLVFLLLPLWVFLFVGLGTFVLAVVMTVWMVLDELVSRVEGK